MILSIDPTEKRDYIAPAKICGEHLDLPEIWCDWGLRDHALLQYSLGGFKSGWNEPLVDWIIQQAQHYNLRALFEVCVDADLSAPYLRQQIRYHFTLGVVSQFNVQDIAYFLRYETLNRPEENSLRYARLLHRMPYGTMQWVPSPDTMSIIEKKIGVIRELV